VDEAREVVRRSFQVQEFEPDPAARQAWGEAYEKMNGLVEKE
jgi:hypothetical protein